ncbi:MAG: tRNA (adenosine(37)-N6)-threonylcarbamoyltransferase complex ATPase subunit type 1 TsaE [Clostridia bacterium]|nr:tRNA (adenosine(37)-N6)-threonylcarbamoyltransferase complex ATPase subunit type 1 TsaE [Clostridia bacterium]
MDLVVFFQSLATNFLSLIATIFEFIGQLPFFVVLFAILFLNFNKKYAYKFWLTYASGFVVGSLFLKNVVQASRPYQDNKSLLAIRNAYSYSLPSATTILSTSNACFFYNSIKNKTTKVLPKIFLVVALTLVVTLTGLSKIYFAQNYLLDVVIGIGIGFILSLIIIKFVKEEKINFKYFFFVLAPILIILLLFFSNQIFTSNFKNSAIFEFVGISLSIVIGCFVEEKTINYQVKNNLLFTSFKTFITLIILIVYYYACKLLPGIVFFSFLKYFVAGFIITLLLPILFKKIENYFYVFSSKVNKDKVSMSSITLSEKSTGKLAKNILSNLKNGDVVLLSGDLGAGKSVLVRNILKHAGVEKSITSPTFTLINEYNTEKYHFYHFDMYRIEDEEEVFNLGFDEILDDKNSIKFIEWPEKVKDHLPKLYKKITIVKLGKNSRNIIIEDYKN